MKKCISKKKSSKRTYFYTRKQVFIFFCFFLLFFYHSYCIFVGWHIYLKPMKRVHTIKNDLKWIKVECSAHLNMNLHEKNFNDAKKILKKNEKKTFFELFCRTILSKIKLKYAFNHLKLMFCIHMWKSFPRKNSFIFFH